MNLGPIQLGPRSKRIRASYNIVFQRVPVAGKESPFPSNQAAYALLTLNEQGQFQRVTNRILQCVAVTVLRKSPPNLR